MPLMSLTIFQQLLQPIRDPKSEAAHHCRRTLNQICDQSPELDGTGDFYMPQFAQVTECEMSWINNEVWTNIVNQFMYINSGIGPAY